MKLEVYMKNLNTFDIIGRFYDYVSGYIYDIIAEIADSEISIYTADQIEYCHEHSDSVKNALWSGICLEPKRYFDYYPDYSIENYEAHLGVGAWYEDNTQEIYNNLDKCLIYAICASIGRDFGDIELTEEQIDILENDIDFDNNNRLEDVIAEAYAALGFMKDEEEED